MRAAAKEGANPFVAFVVAPDEDWGALTSRLSSLNIFYRSPENLGPLASPAWNITGLEGLLQPPLPLFISWADPAVQVAGPRLSPSCSELALCAFSQ